MPIAFQCREELATWKIASSCQKLHERREVILSCNINDMAVNIWFIVAI